MVEALPSYRVREDIRYQRVGGEGVVVRQTEAQVLVLNDLAIRILDEIGAGRSPEELLPHLLEEYAVGAEDLRRDVGVFLAELERLGLLVRDAGAAPGDGR